MAARRWAEAAVAWSGPIPESWKSARRVDRFPRVVEGHATRIRVCGRLIVELQGRRLEDSLRGRQGRLLFASELKSLLQVNDAPREIDPTAIDDYLTYQYVPHPKSIFRGYAKLPPGHAAVYESGRL